MCNTDYLQSFKTSSLSFSRHCRSYRPIVCSVLFSELPTLNPAINSDNFDLDRIKPLLNAALADNPNDLLTSPGERRHRIYPVLPADSIFPPTNPIAPQHN
jgi:hypothetical protein